MVSWDFTSSIQESHVIYVFTDVPLFTDPHIQCYNLSIKKRKMKADIIFTR